MNIKVVLYEDPNTARDAAGCFLASDPVPSNLVATLLATRIVDLDRGRYWVAFDGEEVAGMALQSPLDRGVVLARMVPEVAIVDC